MKNKTKNQIEVGTDLIGVPKQILGITIRNMKWSDFKGKAPENTWFLAHIYWAVFYNVTQKKGGGFDLVVTPRLNEQRAWVDPDCLCHIKLLEHEYGHFLICCLLCLHFKSEMMKQQYQKLGLVDFKTSCAGIFKQIFNHYLQVERLYDQQTNHYLNRQQQLRWQSWFRDQFLRYKKIQEEMSETQANDTKKRGILRSQQPRKIATSSAKQKFRISSRKK